MSARRESDDAGTGNRVLAPPAPSGLEARADPPAFSIVIPTYQSADTVATAIESALAQTLPAREVLVVDDGSTDDLERALRPFEGRIVVVGKENGGGASALNAGARAASGEFMAILDADDTYDPQRVEAMANLAAERPDLDLVTTDAKFVVEGRDKGAFGAETPFATGDQRTAIFKSCFVGGWPGIRIAKLEEVGWFDESLRTGYDWDCWMRILLAGGQAGQDGRALYNYNLHSGSLTTSRASTLWDRVTLLEKVSPDGLSAEERSSLKGEIHLRRNEAASEEIKAVLAGEAERRRLPSLIGARGIGLRARAVAAVAYLAPPLARRILSTRLPPERRFSGAEP